LDSNPFEVAFSPDGKLLATLSEGVTIWDIGTKNRVYQDDGPPLPQTLLFSPDGSWLVVRSGSTAPELYRLARQGDKVAVTKRADTHRALGMVYPLGFSADGKVLFVQPLHRNALSKLQALPTTTWRPRTSFLGRGVVLAPDGQHLAVVGGSEYHNVDLWHVTEPLGD
jgi:WD40 repeat protein